MIRELRNSGGRVGRARAFDALIAAVAIANGLALHTVNPNDFACIRGFDLRPVEHPDRRR